MSPPVRTRWLTYLLPADYLLFHLGYFALLPILPVLIRSELAGGSAFTIGVVLFCFHAATGGSSLLLAPWVGRTSYRTGLCAGLLCSAAGMIVLPYAHTFAPMVGALLIAGAGMSVHGLLARSLIAEVLDADSARNRAYSVLQIAVNVSAAIGPMVASTLYATIANATLLAAVAGCYLVAAALVAGTVPAGVRPQSAGVRRWISRQTVQAIRADPVARRTLAVATAGGFLYAQFFSAIALLVTMFVAKGPTQGLLFLTNAVVVVAFQAPVSAVVDRWLRAGTRPLSMLRFGVCVFSAAMLTLGATLWAGVPVFAALLGAIVIFSVAETVYTPMVNTAFAALPAASPIEAFTVRQLFVTAGESGGALCGAAMLLAIAGDGTGAPYWILLASGGALVVAATSAAPWLSRHTLRTDQGSTDDLSTNDLSTDDRADRLEPGLADLSGRGASRAERSRTGGT